jgi:hypothetical protein
MAIRPEVLRALKEAGATLDMILAALEADRLAEDRDREATLETKRAKDAERQRRHRLSRNVTRVTRDNCDPSPSPGPPSPTKDPPSPPLGAQTPTTKPSRGCALPADWQPKPQHFAKAAAKGQGPEFVHRCAEAMRNWAGANSNRQIARKSNWDQAFAGWQDRELGKLEARPPPGGAVQQSFRSINGKHANVPTTRGSVTAELRAQIEADLLRSDEGESVRPQSLRLLSHH